MERASLLGNLEQQRLDEKVEMALHPKCADDYRITFTAEELQRTERGRGLLAMFRVSRKINAIFDGSAFQNRF
jgi:hypothetical protein